MVQIPEVRRITSSSRTDSFPSLGNSSSSNHEDDLVVTASSPRTELSQENERLRLEMEHLKAQVAQLQRKLNHHQQQQRQPVGSKSPKLPGVFLELPSALRQPALDHKLTNSPLICCSSKRVPSKEERSSSTDDDQETVEPDMELEHHKSAGGLYRRSYQEPSSSTPRPKIRFASGSPATRKTDPMSQDSLSTADDVALMDNEGDVDDDEDDDVECQGLLRSSSEPKLEVDSEPYDEYADNNNFVRVLSDRAGWLVGLLVLQSMSSFILARNEAMLQRHLVIIRFLTMLVGAGGNAGNQASVRVIRGLAVGAINDSNTLQVLKREALMGVCLSLVLGLAGCLRAAVFLTPMLETIAITSSLLMIVTISIVLGALLPLGMKMIGIDPAHSSTTIQVIMDILGVMITVHVSSFVLDSGLFGRL
mmetsp:Transcript_117873/g.176084  ORF Transcript_117873/g.176084 Transcript_117873/m.176084 type:complete len:421 (-) Transcript_117873:6-1268(-)